MLGLRNSSPPVGNPPATVQSKSRMYAKATAFQIGMAVCVVVSVFALAIAVTRRATGDPSPVLGKDKIDILLVQAMTGTNRVIGTSYGTHRSKADTVTNLYPSTNRPEGNQFTLSFKLGLFDATAPTNRCILLWGDPNKTVFKTKGGSSAGETLSHLLVFMPMIWLGSKTRSDGTVEYYIEVYFNTTSTVRNVARGPLQPKKDPGSVRTLIDLEKGCYVTTTFSDYFVNGIASGCICKVFVDTVLIATQSVRGESIRRTRGLMHILPTLPDRRGIDSVSSLELDTIPSNAKISDLSYHNYAFSMADVQSKVGGGVSYGGGEPVSLPGRKKVYDVQQDMAYMYLNSPAHR